MKKFLSIILVFIITLSTACIAVEAAPLVRGAVYVSLEGDDNAPGTLEQPFKTLFAAQKKVRSMKETGAYPGGITVFVRGGTYNLSEPLILTEEDSGTKNAPIAWKNYGDEVVTLVGGVDVSGSDFEKVVDPNVLNRIVDEKSRDSLYMIDLTEYGLTNFGLPPMPGSYSIHRETINRGFVPEQKASGMEFLFNGNALTNARYPNSGMLEVANVMDPGDNGDTDENGGIWVEGKGFTIKVDDDRMQYWNKSMEDGNPMFYGLWRYEWADQAIPIAKIDATSKQLTSKWFSIFSVRQGAKFYVYNLLEELDTPGEYYLDRETGVFYVNPPSNISKARLTITVMEESIIQLKKASNITLKGIDVKGARASAITIEGGENNRIVDSEISYTAKNAVTISGTNNGIIDSHVFETNGGINLTGGDISTLTASENYAYNNNIERYSRITKTYRSGVSVSGVGNIAAYNEIHDAPHMAIAFGGQKSKIMYNDVYDVLQTADDSGAIYGGMNWHERGVEIKYNYIHDVTTSGSGDGGGVHAIYADGGQCELYIIGNIIENFQGQSIKLNGGWDNVAINNYFINNSKPAVEANDSMHMYGFSDHNRVLEPVKDAIFNSAQWKEQFPTFFRMMELSEDERRTPQGNVMVNNLSYNCDLYTKSTPNFMEIGKNHNAKKDPGFVDIANRDYNLKADSKLYDEMPGFKAIPFTSIGRLDERAQMRAKKAVIMSVNSPKSLVKGQITSIDESPSVIPFIEGDRTYVPLRFLSENLGATVEFNDGHIAITTEESNLEFTLNSLEGKKNGEAFTLEKPLTVIDGRTFVPLRQVSELLGYSVFWHPMGFISISEDPTLFVDDETEVPMIMHLNEKIRLY